METFEFFSYHVTWSLSDEGFEGTALELPGLRSVGQSPAEALEGIRALVKREVFERTARGEFVPVPLSVRKFSGSFTTRVPHSLHRDLAVQAAREGVSLSALVTSLLSRGVGLE